MGSLIETLVCHSAHKSAHQGLDIDQSREELVKSLEEQLRAFYGQIR
jgi:hypothetical protein